MRDDRHRWDAPQRLDAPLESRGLRLSSLPLERQVFVSGPSVLTQMPVPVVAWPDPVFEDSYALALRRDRVLWVNGPEIADGWDPSSGQAVSNMSDGFEAYELSGEAAFELLKRGTEITLGEPSGSVIRLLFGLEVFVYRYRDEATYRLHVNAAQSDALIKHLRAACAQL
ncbi:MAG: hypothetical protein AAGF79_08975 [Pseudomonadota bacterium]